LAVGAAAFLAVALSSPPSAPSIDSDRPEPPSPEEVQALVDLYQWILGDAAGSQFRAFGDEPLREAIQSRKRGFDLFRGYNDRAARDEILDSLPYGRLIASAARSEGLDALLFAALVEAESGFHPEAVSPVGALGLAQVLESTVELHGGGDPLDPARNLQVGARHLKMLLDLFEGDIALALAAYNAGPGAVARFGDIPPYRETRTYVDRVLSRYVDYHRQLWQHSPANGWLF
jgi:soluble lytic murein transglycosylase-like protein